MIRKRTKHTIYEAPQNSEILEAYLNKHASYNKADARRIKRQLRKLAFSR